MRTPRKNQAKTVRRRKDIQALRALAVMMVVLNHFWPHRLSGGFIGVDVFFVISGFLITSHLLRELQATQRIKLSRFYQRRANRLLPAALLVTLVSLGLVLLAFPIPKWAGNATEAFTSTAYVQNWWLASQAVDYFAQQNAATVFQHYWSLSVEEQFYLLWPVLLIGIFALAVKIRKTPPSAAQLTAVISILWIASLVFSVIQTAHSPAAYFNTFGRAWELLTGALIATQAAPLARVFASGRGVSNAAQTIAQLAGYAMIAYAALRFTAETAFPGPWALLPVLGTALIIAAGPGIARFNPARLGELPPVQFIGNISYSLYLWHWPLLLAAPYLLNRPVTPRDLVAVLLLSIALAAVTKIFVEDRFRDRLLAPRRPRTTGLLVAASIAVLALLSGYVGAIHTPNAYAAADRAMAEAQQNADPNCVGAAALDPARGCTDPFGPAVTLADWGKDEPLLATREECAPREDIGLSLGPIVECDFTGGDPDARTVLLVGDSHAAHMLGALLPVAEHEGWQLFHTYAASCIPLDITVTKHRGADFPPDGAAQCLAWAGEVSTRIGTIEADTVIMVNHANKEVDDGSGKPQTEQLADALQRTTSAWADPGTQIVVIRDAPEGGDILGPECTYSFGARDRGCVSPQDQQLLPDHLAAAAFAAGIPVVDLSDRFCDGETCSGVVGGLPVFIDGDHVALRFAETLAPTLGERLQEAIP